jgi:uncharacterized protein (TIGR02300 family)
MTTPSAYDANKAARGTKRTCQACQARFYDLMRQPAVCPCCGVEQALAKAMPVPERRVVSGRRRSNSQAVPAPIEPELAGSEAPEDAEVSADEVAVVDAPAEDTVLDQEADDGDMSDLLDVEMDEPKER